MFPIARREIARLLPAWVWLNLEPDPFKSPRSSSRVYIMLSFSGRGYPAMLYTPTAQAEFFLVTRHGVGKRPGSYHPHLRMKSIYAPGLIFARQVNTVRSMMR